MSTSRRGRIWSSALYEVPESFVPGDPLGRPIALFRPQWAGWPGALHTLADPFLFARGGRLYLFMEAQSGASPGRIVCRSTADLSHFDDEGTVLEGATHLSYPCVFEWGSEVYMIPESASAGEVALYRFRDFPRGLEKARVLLRGPYVDSSILIEGNQTFLFTSTSEALHLFYLQDILKDIPEPISLDPLPVRPSLIRCGGAPIRAGGKLFRLAQHAQYYYGEALAACIVNGLAIDSYRETVVEDDVLGVREAWRSGGGHHMSLAKFNGRTIVAVDGQAEEPYWLWAAKRPVKWLLRRSAGAAD